MEALEGLRGQPKAVQVLLLKGFAIQFSSFYKNFCEVNKLVERRKIFERAISSILSNRPPIDLELVTDIRKRPSPTPPDYNSTASIRLTC